jgi:hypothetical protein
MAVAFVSQPCDLLSRRVDYYESGSQLQELSSEENMMLGWIARFTRNRRTGSGLISNVYRQAGVPVAEDDRLVTPAVLAQQIQASTGTGDGHA